MHLSDIRFESDIIISVVLYAHILTVKSKRTVIEKNKISAEPLVVKLWILRDSKSTVFHFEKTYFHFNILIDLIMQFKKKSYVPRLVFFRFY